MQGVDVRLRPGPLPLHRLPPLRLRLREGEQPVPGSADPLDPRAADGQGRRASTSCTPTPTTTPRRCPRRATSTCRCSASSARTRPASRSAPCGATWQEQDGITVVDYNWCIGCRYCMAACPYGARHFNWGEPHAPARRAQPRHPLPGQPAAHQGRGGEVHLLHPAHRKGLLPGLRGGLPHGHAQVRQPARPQAARSATSWRTSASSSSRKSSTRSPSSSTSTGCEAMETLRTFGASPSDSLRLVFAGRPRTTTPGWASCCPHRDGRVAYAGPAAPRPHRHPHARPGLLGLLHRQLHLPGGRGRGGHHAGHPRLRLPLEAHQGDHPPGRAAGHQRPRHVPGLRARGHRPARPLLAHHALRGPAQLPQLPAGLGRPRPQRLPAAELVHRHLPALLRLHRPPYSQGARATRWCSSPSPWR